MDSELVTQIPMDAFMNQMKQFESEHASGMMIYIYTKKFLEQHKDVLSPQEKGELFVKYLRLWEKMRCTLSISNTDYAQMYESSSYSYRYNWQYIPSWPMLAGFNLQGAIILDVCYPSFLVFPSVNLMQAHFPNVKLYDAAFKNCDLSQVNFTNANFGKSSFTQCNLKNACLKHTSLNEVTFYKCELQNTHFPETDFINLLFHECNLSDIYFKIPDYFSNLMFLDCFTGDCKDVKLDYFEKLFAIKEKEHKLLQVKCIESYSFFANKQKSQSIEADEIDEDLDLGVSAIKLLFVE